MQGYDALRQSSAWFDVSTRGRIKLTGEDRARLLHAMCTNNIHALKPDEGCYAFFLTAQGRILADAHILCRPDHFLVGTEPETRAKLLDHLDRFIIADDVTLEDVTETTACIAVEGPQAEARLRELGAPIPDGPDCSEEWGPRLVYKVSDEQLRVITFPGDTDLTARLGEPADSEAANVVRLERGTPRYGDDILEKHLVQETRQLHAVHFSKGCYIGQEIVERVRSRGAVHKGLASIEIEGTEAMASGAEILDDEGKKCGDLMSSAYSPALGKVVAMAYLRGDQLGPQAKPMTVNGAAVTVR
jgi:folate-binding protein YgfZ